ncbi:4296_t:CDS:2 [Funneliformis mosseae]|uniref:4296_t:CDS:1 n=1 Tax=Funneliformis mosseae TaxID=27381 RepID=A0A9N9HV37_FUNMO|nr:4296_t:CDS:2 [Funneliformis mosseae]
MSDPKVESSFRNYRFKKKFKNNTFFADTDARQWSFYRFYTSILYSGDSPKIFNEIFDKWNISLNFIRKDDSTPKSIVNFVKELIEYNDSKVFRELREACERNFHTHVLSYISSNSVAKSEMTQGYMKQSKEILSGELHKRSASDLSEDDDDHENIGKTNGQKRKKSPLSNKRQRSYLSDDDELLSSDSEIVPVSLTNVFRETSDECSYSDSDESKDKMTESSTSTKRVENKRPMTKKRQYITQDIASDALKAYRMRVLPGDKLIYDYMDVLDYKRDEAGNSPISIGVINFYNTDCSKYLPLDYKKFIANQLQDKEIKAVNFTKGRTIDKFLVNCEEGVMQFLDKFKHIKDLESLGRCLGENLINYSTASNDLIYVQHLLQHFYFLYKNDTLLQAMSEQLASISYNKLKEILNIAGKSGPKLDGKAFLRSLGTEVLAQEDGILSTCGKRKGDLRKLEYCTKVILTALYLSLPTSAKARIIDIETYCLQSNGFQLTISASKYLFEDTIITMDLQDIEVPRTVEAFSKLITAIKVILSWKARTKKNTDVFYEVLEEGHGRLINEEHFTPKKFSIN